MLFLWNTKRTFRIIYIIVIFVFVIFYIRSPYPILRLRTIFSPIIPVFYKIPSFVTIYLTPVCFKIAINLFCIINHLPFAILRNIKLIMLFLRNTKRTFRIIYIVIIFVFVIFHIRSPYPILRLRTVFCPIIPVFHKIPSFISK